MGTARIETNQLVKMDGVEYLLLRKVTATLWQLEETKTKRIVEYELKQILQMQMDGTLVFPGSGSVKHCGAANSAVSITDDEVAKTRLAYVREALKVPNSHPCLQRTIEEVWNRIKAPNKMPASTTVYLWKRRYSESKHDYRALVDNRSAKGNRSSRYPCEILEICNQSIEAKFLQRERNTIQDTLENAIMRVTDENKLRLASMALRLPTRRLIKRLIANIPEFDKHSARYGRESARKTFRAVRGHSNTESPLQRAEMDHTILDLFVVDDKTSLPLGRPYVTACIDDYSRCILGIYVGFIPPSYQTVAQCLKDCFLPKVGLREEYPNIRSDWPAYGIMRELVLDNGREFHSESLEQVCYSLGIEMHYSARREPWFKGKIERFFGTLNRGVAHGNPGTSFSDIFEKGDYDPTTHALITLSNLKNIIRLWTADVYHQQFHRGIQTTPAKMWTSSICPEDIRFPDESIHLDAVMGRVDRRVLTHKGIEFEGLFYNSHELTELRRQKGANIEVDIRVDESNIGSIYVLSPTSSMPYSVPALNSDYASGVSLWQHKIFKKQQRKDSAADQGPNGWLEAKQTIAKMIAEDFLRKQNKTRKRVGRYREDPEQDPTKKSRHETRSSQSQVPAITVSGHPLVEDTRSAAIQFDSVAAPTTPSNAPHRLKFKTIYKEGYNHD